MSSIDRLTREMEDVRRVKGQSKLFDQEILSAEKLYQRALDCARGRSDAGFAGSKAERAIHRLKFEFGHKRVKCVSCNGSGRYDNAGSPDCGACDGSGKETSPGPYAYQTLKRHTQTG